jgi:hypothetical protein
VQDDQQFQALTEYLAARVQTHLAPAFGARYGMAPSTVEELARIFLADAEFKAIQLGGYLETPDGQLLARAVQLALPYPYRAQVAFVVAALELAADLQRKEKRVNAGVVLVAATLLTWFGFSVIRSAGATT